MFTERRRFTGSASEAPIDFKQMKKNHGILAIFGWGLILPLGAIVPRYFKHKDPLWYYLHSIIQFVGFVIGLAAVVLGQQLYAKIDANFQTHRGIGIFVLVLSILQVCSSQLYPLVVQLLLLFPDHKLITFEFLTLGFLDIGIFSKTKQGWQV